jgi:hypothetical protein
VPCTDSFPRRLRALCAAAGLGGLAACHTPMPPDTSAMPARPPPSATRPPPAAMDMNEYRLRFASKLVAANPDLTYSTPAPETLLAIPVLEIEVNADGSVRRINVLRTPTQATDTVQIAIDAVRRAAPFGDASHLPRPWKFSETFLFDDDRRFKPRTLD